MARHQSHPIKPFENPFSEGPLQKFFCQCTFSTVVRIPKDPQIFPFANRSNVPWTPLKTDLLTFIQFETWLVPKQEAADEWPSVWRQHGEQSSRE